MRRIENHLKELICEVWVDAIEAQSLSNKASLPYNNRETTYTTNC